jgi:hypothetical protein
MALKTIYGEGFGPLPGCVHHARKGWHTQIAGEYQKPSGVIGVVVAPKFPDLDIIRKTIREGAERRPEDVWVIREKPQANHAVVAVWETLDELGIEPMLAPLNPAWAAKREEHGYDLRRKWADAELSNTCERVIVFHDISSQVTAGWGDKLCAARVFIIERGEKRTAAKRKGRKPVGA